MKKSVSFILLGSLLLGLNANAGDSAAQTSVKAVTAGSDIGLAAGAKIEIETKNFSINTTLLGSSTDHVRGSIEGSGPALALGSDNESIDLRLGSSGAGVSAFGPQYRTVELSAQGTAGLKEGDAPRSSYATVSTGPEVAFSNVYAKGFFAPQIHTTSAKINLEAAGGAAYIAKDDKGVPLVGAQAKLEADHRSLFYVGNGHLIGVSGKLGGEVLQNLIGDVNRIVSGRANVSFAWKPNDKLLVEAGPEAVVTSITLKDIKNADGTFAQVPAETQYYVGAAIGVKFE